MAGGEEARTRFYARKTFPYTKINEITLKNFIYRGDKGRLELLSVKKMVISF